MWFVFLAGVMCGVVVTSLVWQCLLRRILETLEESHQLNCELTSRLL